jgi:amidase
VLADGLALLQGGTPLQSNYDPLVWCMIEAGRKLTATDYQSARFVLDSTSRRIAQFMQPYDVLLSPTLTQPAPSLDHIDIRSTDLAEQMKRAETLVAYAPIANASGMPALSLPLHMSPDGVPIGMHFMAAACEEALLLRLGRQLEIAVPWQDRHPAGFHE